MKCPIDNTDLAMSDRQGIEIDYCPQCRGVWLDRGELDKIIERSALVSESNSADKSAPSREHDYRRDDRYDERRGKGKREGFLGNLFDFGG